MVRLKSMLLESMGFSLPLAQNLLASGGGETSFFDGQWHRTYCASSVRIFGKGILELFWLIK